MRNESFTLMVVGGAHQEVRRVRVEQRRIALVAGIVLGVLVAVAGSLIHYVVLVDQGLTTAALRAEHDALTQRLSTLTTKARALENELKQVEVVDRDIRTLADLPVRPRELAVGPVQTPSGAAGGGTDVEAFSVALPSSLGVGIDADLLEGRIDALARESARASGSLGDLVEFFTARAQLLASTPSVWPTRGWITSSFGWRDDPFTGGQVMHAGVDLAAPEGTQVVAPAAGTVVFAGDNGGYGRLIAIDHGRGILTHYGHLNRILVKVGQVVERGQHIGAVGNTGRSTGPHLHYEVRVNGIPTNPRTYVLEW